MRKSTAAIVLGVLLLIVLILREQYTENTKVYDTTYTVYAPNGGQFVVKNLQPRQYGICGETKDGRKVVILGGFYLVENARKAEHD